MAFLWGRDWCMVGLVKNAVHLFFLAYFFVKLETLKPTGEAFLNNHEWFTIVSASWSFNCTLRSWRLMKGEIASTINMKQRERKNSKACTRPFSGFGATFFFPVRKVDIFAFRLHKKWALLFTFRFLRRYEVYLSYLSPRVMIHFQRWNLTKVIFYKITDTCLTSMRE